MNCDKYVIGLALKGENILFPESLMSKPEDCRPVSPPAELKGIGLTTLKPSPSIISLSPLEITLLSEYNPSPLVVLGSVSSSVTALARLCSLPDFRIKTCYNH
jgi:hypothetical protein